MTSIFYEPPLTGVANHPVVIQSPVVASSNFTESPHGAATVVPVKLTSAILPAVGRAHKVPDVQPNATGIANRSAETGPLGVFPQFEIPTFDITANYGNGS